jgi:hypothetical protein
MQYKTGSAGMYCTIVEYKIRRSGVDTQAFAP